MRVEPGEHDVATGVAIGDADVGMLEAKRFPRELVSAGGSVLELASKTAEGIGGHVIDGDKQHVDRHCKNSGDRKEEKGDSSRKELVHYALAVPEKSR